jgi:protein involved in polysaccharide export with SLBB domain
MTITDAIILSGGFKNNADRTNVTLTRNISTENGLSTVEITDYSFDKNYKTDNDILLKNNDVITVRNIPFNRSSKFYRITGKVGAPGDFAIYKEKLTVSEILKNLEYEVTANINQIHIIRDGIKVPINNLKSSDFLINDGDVVIVPKIDNTIIVNGAVNQASILDFNLSKSFKKSISSSGGFRKNADKKRAFVIYPNGLKKQTRSFLFFKNYPKIIPGSEIIVPPRAEKNNGTSVAEIVGYSTSLVSIIALIKSF